MSFIFNSIFVNYYIVTIVLTRSPSRIVRGVGKFITPPTKALRAMDVYANSLAYDGQMAALAKRSWNLGKKSGDFKAFKKNFLKNNFSN